MFLIKNIHKLSLKCSYLGGSIFYFCLFEDILRAKLFFGFIKLNISFFNVRIFFLYLHKRKSCMLYFGVFSNFGIPLEPQKRKTSKIGLSYVMSHLPDAHSEWNFTGISARQFGISVYIVKCYRLILRRRPANNATQCMLIS